MLTNTNSYSVDSWAAAKSIMGNLCGYMTAYIQSSYFEGTFPHGRTVEKCSPTSPAQL